MNYAKKYWKIVTAFIAILLGLIVFVLCGCATKPPTAFERRMFDIQTNTFPIIVIKTNVIPYTVLATNYVQVTNELHVTEIVTNVTPILVYKTNVVSQTETNETYSYTPGPGAQRLAETGSLFGNLFGAGGLVSSAILGIFSIWGYVRSNKNHVTAANLAQTVETIREFVRNLPNGSQYDNELVNWMQKHQAEAGVLNQVLAILAAEVSNPDAKTAADQIIKTINALQGLTMPLPKSTV